jgi:hypothetical protein
MVCLSLRTVTPGVAANRRYCVESESKTQVCRRIPRRTWMGRGAGSSLLSHALPRNRLPHASCCSKRGHSCGRKLEIFSDTPARPPLFHWPQSSMFSSHSQRSPVHAIGPPCPTGCIDTTVRRTRISSQPVVTGDCRCWVVRGTATCFFACSNRLGDDIALWWWDTW